MRTIGLLIVSNVFMTIAWYWHLRETNIPLGKAIIISWGIAFFEYCLTVPANRIGYTTGWNGFQLKIVQEVITVIIFSVFAVLYLKEPFEWKYLISFIFYWVQYVLRLKNKTKGITHIAMTPRFNPAASLYLKVFLNFFDTSFVFHGIIVASQSLYLKCLWKH